MRLVDFVDIIALACAIGAAITVGRTGLLKQTIAAQTSLIKTLTEENAQQDRRIGYLEAIINGDPGMVGKGNLASGIRCGCGNCTASPKTPKNRNP